MTIKKQKLNSIGTWLTAFQTKFSGIAYRLQGADTSMLEKLSADQLSLVLSMVTCAYGIGHEESRRFWSPKYHAMREAAERATGDINISFSGLRLVEQETENTESENIPNIPFTENDIPF